MIWSAHSSLGILMPITNHVYSTLWDTNHIPLAFPSHIQRFHDNT